MAGPGRDLVGEEEITEVVQVRWSSGMGVSVPNLVLFGWRGRGSPEVRRECAARFRGVAGGTRRSGPGAQW